MKMISKITKLVNPHWAEIVLVIGVILISIISFSAGYLTAKEQIKDGVRFEDISK